VCGGDPEKSKQKDGMKESEVPRESGPKKFREEDIKRRDLHAVVTGERECNNELIRDFSKKKNGRLGQRPINTRNHAECLESSSNLLQTIARVNFRINSSGFGVRKGPVGSG